MKSFLNSPLEAAADSQASAGNLLIDSFPVKARAKLAAHFHKISLPAGHFLYQPDQTADNLYFPTTSVTVEFTMTESGGSIQTAMIGREAVPALSPFLSGGKIKIFTQVLISGEFLQIDARALKTETDASPELQQILLDQLDRHVNQLSNVLRCRAFHPIEQRLCRWLLTLAEKCNHPTIKLPITHQQIASLLGVMRPPISVAAKNLERQKIISYSRGKLSILNPERLRTLVCD